MTKEQIRAELEARGTLRVTKSQDPLWPKAFEEYNRVKKQNLNIKCGGCWNKVREWLLS